MLKKILVFHVLPIAISIGLVYLIVEFTSPIRPEAKEKLDIIKGKQEMTKGLHANMLSGEQAELDYIASIISKDQLTIFGSSEFSASPFTSYNFLPDSTGIKAMGFGHAYHQELSILCELLAVNEYVEGSKICIILSPSWFDTRGTNIEAFIEFVRPNFLNKIANDDSIDDKYKIHIGEYLNNNFSSIEGVSHSMNKLRDLYLDHNDGAINKYTSIIRRKIMGKPDVTKVKYEVSLNDDTYDYRWNNEFEQTAKRVQSEFLDQIKDNEMYVNDEYYNEYVRESDGSPRYGETPEIDLDNCPEFDDFKLLIEYLVEKNIECSFVIQPLNPYHYKNVERRNELIQTITQTLDKHKFPYLNLYASSKKDYDPGTLKDIMHLGDYGWMKVNKFLYDLHHD